MLRDLFLKRNSVIFLVSNHGCRSLELWVAVLTRWLRHFWFYERIAFLGSPSSKENL